MNSTTVESQPITVDRPVEKVFAFLQDLRNYKNLIPEEMGEVEAEADIAQLDLKGLGKFQLELENSTLNEKIELKPSGSKLPFDFNIEWITSEDQGKTRVQAKINAKLNMFMKMMAEPKLRSFVDKQATRLKEYLEQEID